MNLKSDGKSNCLYSKLSRGAGQCKRLEIDLNLPACSNETKSTHNITNSDDEALSWYAGTESRKLEYEHQQSLNGGSHTDNSVSDTMDSSQKDASRKKEYYRCTYRNTHGCCATKQVQRSSQDPTTFDITYLGKHTCPKISKTNDTSSAPESGYGLLNFSSNSSNGSSAITRNSFELSNWRLNHSR